MGNKSSSETSLYRGKLPIDGHYPSILDWSFLMEGTTPILSSIYDALYSENNSSVQNTDKDYDTCVSSSSQSTYYFIPILPSKTQLLFFLTPQSSQIDQILYDAFHFENKKEKKSPSKSTNQAQISYTRSAFQNGINDQLADILKSQQACVTEGGLANLPELDDRTSSNSKSIPETSKKSLLTTSKGPIDDSNTIPKSFFLYQFLDYTTAYDKFRFFFDVAQNLQISHQSLTSQIKFPTPLKLDTNNITLTPRNPKDLSTPTTSQKKSPSYEKPLKQEKITKTNQNIILESLYQQLISIQFLSRYFCPFDNIQKDPHHVFDREYLAAHPELTLPSTQLVLAANSKYINFYKRAQTYDALHNSTTPSQTSPPSTIKNSPSSGLPPLFPRIYSPFTPHPAQQQSTTNTFQVTPSHVSAIIFGLDVHLPYSINMFYQYFSQLMEDYAGGVPYLLKLKTTPILILLFNVDGFFDYYQQNGFGDNEVIEYLSYLGLDCVKIAHVSCANVGKNDQHGRYHVGQLRNTLQQFLFDVINHHIISPLNGMDLSHKTMKNEKKSMKNVHITPKLGMNSSLSTDSTLQRLFRFHIAQNNTPVQYYQQIFSILANNQNAQSDDLNTNVFNAQDTDCFTPTEHSPTSNTFYFPMFSFPSDIRLLYPYKSLHFTTSLYFNPTTIPSHLNPKIQIFSFLRNPGDRPYEEGDPPAKQQRQNHGTKRLPTLSEYEYNHILYSRDKKNNHQSNSYDVLHPLNRISLLHEAFQNVYDPPLESLSKQLQLNHDNLIGFESNKSDSLLPPLLKKQFLASYHLLLYPTTSAYTPSQNILDSLISVLKTPLKQKTTSPLMSPPSRISHFRSTPTHHSNHPSVTFSHGRVDSMDLLDLGNDYFEESKSRMLSPSVLSSSNPSNFISISGSQLPSPTLSVPFFCPLEQHISPLFHTTTSENRKTFENDQNNSLIADIQQISPNDDIHQDLTKNTDEISPNITINKAENSSESQLLTTSVNQEITSSIKLEKEEEVLYLEDIPLNIYDDVYNSPDEDSYTNSDEEDGIGNYNSFPYNSVQQSKSQSIFLSSNNLQENRSRLKVIGPESDLHTTGTFSSLQPYDHDNLVHTTAPPLKTLVSSEIPIFSPLIDDEEQADSPHPTPRLESSPKPQRFSTPSNIPSSLPSSQPLTIFDLKEPFEPILHFDHHFTDQTFPLDFHREINNHAIVEKAIYKSKNQGQSPVLKPSVPPNHPIPSVKVSSGLSKHEVLHFGVSLQNPDSQQSNDFAFENDNYNEGYDEVWEALESDELDISKNETNVPSPNNTKYSTRDNNAIHCHLIKKSVTFDMSAFSTPSRNLFPHESNQYIVEPIVYNSQNVCKDQNYLPPSNLDPTSPSPELAPPCPISPMYYSFIPTPHSILPPADDTMPKVFPINSDPLGETNPASEISCHSLLTNITVYSATKSAILLPQTKFSDFFQPLNTKMHLFPQDSAGMIFILPFIPPAIEEMDSSSGEFDVRKPPKPCPINSIFSNFIQNFFFNVYLRAPLLHPTPVFILLAYESPPPDYFLNKSTTDIAHLQSNDQHDPYLWMSPDDYQNYVKVAMKNAFLSQRAKNTTGSLSSLEIYNTTMFDNFWHFCIVKQPVAKITPEEYRYGDHGTTLSYTHRISEQAHNAILQQSLLLAQCQYIHNIRCAIQQQKLYKQSPHW